MGFRFVRRTALAVGALLVLAACVLTWLRNARSGLALDVPRTTPAGPTASVRVTFLGVSTLLIEDGTTAIMTDGFFTRPGPGHVLTAPIRADPAPGRRRSPRTGGATP